MWRFTVIGVTPPEFFGADPDSPPDVYVPMHAESAAGNDGPVLPAGASLLSMRRYDWVVMMARLAPRGERSAGTGSARDGLFAELQRATNPKEKAGKPSEADGCGGRQADWTVLRRRYSKPLYFTVDAGGPDPDDCVARNIANLLLAARGPHGSARDRGATEYGGGGGSG